jgi:nanoRNase/pAp phosphatase (c-di-AMP/oligoRNAs hydrolase)
MLRCRKHRTPSPDCLACAIAAAENAEGTKPRRSIRSVRELRERERAVARRAAELVRPTVPSDCKETTESADHRGDK